MNQNLCSAITKTNILVMNGKHTSSSTEAVIRTAEINFADTILAQGGGTHNAWFNCYVEVGLVKDGGGLGL